MSRQRPRLIHTLLLILAAGVLAFFFASVAETPHVHGQSSGNVQLATVVQTLNITTTAATTFTKITKNVGQTAHVIQFFFGGGSHNCVYDFDSSTDNFHWLELGAISDTQFQVNITGTNIAVLQASGYYPYLRIRANSAANPACSGGGATVIYTGSQSPFPITTTTFPVSQVGTGYPLTPITPLGTAASSTTPGSHNFPFVLSGVNCFNVTGGPSFLEISDSPIGTTAPVPPPGSDAVLETEVPAGQTYTYPGPPVIGYQGLWVGSTSTYHGTTPGNLQCTFEVTGNGPFGPLYPGVFP